MAAIIAKDLGKDVAIIEATDRIGKKILTTGNGRCNISNSRISFPYDTYHSSNKDFYIDCLEQLGVEETRNLFLSIGLPIVELEKGKVISSFSSGFICGRSSKISYRRKRNSFIHKLQSKNYPQE